MKKIVYIGMVGVFLFSCGAREQEMDHEYSNLFKGGKYPDPWVVIYNFCAILLV